MQFERHEIRVFSALVEEGGFRRAADRLNVSQSAVSQAVSNLEHKLDALLVERRGGLKLTEAGKRVFSFARLVIQEEESALADLAAIRSGALSTLSLAMNSMFKRFLGRNLLLAFCERNPLTRLKLSVAPSREIVYGVDEDRWELGLGPFQTQMPGHFRLMPFLSEDRTLVAHERHPRFEALRRDAVAELPRTTLLTAYLDPAAKRPGATRIRNQFHSVWEVSDLELRLALAAAGKGVLYLSDRVREEMPGFHPIPGLAISTFPRQVGLYYKRHRALSEGAKRFLAVCRARFGAGAPKRSDA